MSNLPRQGMEAVLLLLVGTAPWLFGSVHPLAELLLFAGLTVIALLWVTCIAMERRPLWNPCAVTIGLASLCVLAIVQLTPMPERVLRGVSPATAQLREKLLPAAPETLETPSDILGVYPPPATISLAPWATRQTLIRLIAVLFLFSAIRANFPAPETFYRLAIVVVVNGVALSFMALAQSFSSPQNMLFWCYPTEGEVFGPFICRNHFAYFINLSIGLGIGLLLSTRHFRGNSTGPRRITEALPSILQDPAVLWVGSALIVMTAALCCSMSRGGMATLLIAAAVCVGMHWRHAGRFTSWISGLVFVGFGVALTTWLGAGVVGRRIATLWESNVLEEGRTPIWHRMLGLFADFPFLGTGMGTLRFVEPLTRGPTDSASIIHEHMHNDYLEALIEGGIVELALVLAVAFLVFRAGFRAFRRHQGTAHGSMAIGALFGLIAVAVHSTVDFGLHIPAVMLLAITICACMTNLEEWPVLPAEGAVIPSTKVGNPWAAGMQALALILVAVFVLEDAWRVERAERYRLAANAVAPKDFDTRIAYLESALTYEPSNPLLHVAVADLYRLRQQAQNDRVDLAWRVGAWSSLCGQDWAATLAAARRAGDTPTNAPSITGDTSAGFAHCFQARAQCPCLVQPQLFMAAYAEQFRRAEPAEDYLTRACLLDPSNSKTWYVAGLKALRLGQLDRGWDCWRRSLQCNTHHLSDILAQALPVLSSGELIQKVIPQDPAVLYETSLKLEKTDIAGNGPKQCLIAALAVLDHCATKIHTQWILQARIQVRLELVDAAVNSYSEALALDPNRADWRLEYCQYLADNGRLRDARRELLVLESLHPQYSQRAKELYEIVNRNTAIDEGAPGAIVK
jgi:O-antigen ligase/Tfp pilus assembly protein PilF